MRQAEKTGASLGNSRRGRSVIDAQDAEWQEFVSELRARGSPPFEEHLARFHEILSARAAEHGPPTLWTPSPDVVARSNLGRFMAEQGLSSYDELHRWSVASREEFWRETIRHLGIVFGRRPEKILGRPDSPKDPQWLRGAKLNVADSCFQAQPDRPAVVTGWEGTSELRTTTYAELEALASSFAKGLRAAGLEPGAGVALYMPMTVECVAAYLGIVRAGGRVVSIADSFTAGEVRRRLQISGAKAIVTVARYPRSGREIRLYEKVKEAQAPRAVVLCGSSKRMPDLRPGDCEWSEFLEDRGELDSRMADPQEVTNILFSSGTTGEPKAIPWTHLTPIKCASDGHFHLDIQPPDVVAWPTNIGWMMGPWLIYATLVNRATMALYEGAPKGAAFARFIQDSGVSVLGAVPTLVRTWRSSGVLDNLDWSGVRIFGSTGEPSNPEDYLWLMSRTGYRAPVIEYCGGTEIGGAYLTGAVAQPASPGTFTTPALGMDLVVLDDQKQPVKRGESGEVFLIPPSLGLSEILLNQDHDDAYYRGIPAGPGGEVLRRHGDRMERLHKGFWRAGGRTDDTLNLSGIKASSVRIEEVLDDHEGVMESAVVGVPLEGDGAERLVVFLVPAGPPAESPDLRGDLQRRLSRELNPLFRIHDVVMVDALPRTASGKVMRRLLRDQYRSQA